MTPATVMGAFSLTPDFEMIRHGTGKPTVEIDLGAIGDRKVILCDARSSSTLATSDRDEKRDTAKLITALSLGCRRFSRRHRIAPAHDRRRRRSFTGPDGFTREPAPLTAQV